MFLIDVRLLKPPRYFSYYLISISRSEIGEEALVAEALTDFFVSPFIIML